MQEIECKPSGVVGPIGRRAKRDAGGERQGGLLEMGLRPWVEAISRLAARREWVLELLGERRSAAILRGLAASADPDDKRLALSQLDRLPEWLDLLTTWLDQPPEEHLVLEALSGVSRLTGPYAQLALRTYLHREAQRALADDSPADYLWDLSLRVARWSREWSSLSSHSPGPGRPPERAGSEYRSLCAALLDGSRLPGGSSATWLVYSKPGRIPQRQGLYPANLLFWHRSRVERCPLLTERACHRRLPLAPPARRCRGRLE